MAKQNTSNRQLLVGAPSSWAMRAWIAAKLAGVELDEMVMDLHTPSGLEKLRALSPTGLMPLLIDGNLQVHESLAIVEYLNEIGEQSPWPSNIHDRALARSYCAEMHAGFVQLRAQCPYFLGEPKIVELNGELRRELKRVNAIWQSAKKPFLFGEPCAADGFFAILAYRLKLYSIELEPASMDYQNQLLEWDLLQQAIARCEQWAEDIKR